MGKKIKKVIIHIKNFILDFMYPTEDLCVCCGEEAANKLCYRCRDNIKRTDRHESYGYHGGSISKMIIKFKMLRDFSCGNVLSGFLIEKIKEEELREYILTYVPMTRGSMRKRGFNQSEYMCKIIAFNLDMDMENTLKKIKKTKEQKSCTAQERRGNVKEAFKARNNKVLGKKFLIIDDVMTTGSTLEECKKTLLNSGAKEVKVLTVSRSHI